MKNSISKKLFAFIVASTMFSAIVNAQSGHASFKSQLAPKSQTQLQIKKQPESQQTATVVACNCSKLGYGCFAGSWGCRFACGIFCRNHVLISNGESNSTNIAFYV